MLVTHLDTRINIILGETKTLGDLSPVYLSNKVKLHYSRLGWAEKSREVLGCWRELGTHSRGLGRGHWVKAVRVWELRTPLTPHRKVRDEQAWRYSNKWPILIVIGSLGTGMRSTGHKRCLLWRCSKAYTRHAEAQGHIVGFEIGTTRSLKIHNHSVWSLVLSLFLIYCSCGDT